MSTPPPNPKICHITHVNNLAGIIETGVLWSDAKRVELGLGCQVVGMSNIKRRRLEELPVKCHPGTMVGECVPFYFCPRSIMLYILHMGNHPDLSYTSGQGPIVHLIADLGATVEWAETEGRVWAFTDCNAGAAYASFFSSLDDLHQINWQAVAAKDFRDAAVKDGKQAEFLVYESFPWALVESIGVIDAQIEAQVNGILDSAARKPLVSVQRNWYY